MTTWSWQALCEKYTPIGEKDIAYRFSNGREFERPQNPYEHAEEDEE
jgi:hypothetical protein